MLTRLAAVPALILTLILLAAATPAWATIDSVKSFKEAYPGKEPKAYSCKVCHLGAIGKKGDLNGYGKVLEAFKGPGNAKKLPVEDYRAVEAEDPDEDGATTLEELTAGTDPSDPASIPEGLEGDEPEEGKVEGTGDEGEGEGEEHEHHHEGESSRAAPHSSGSVQDYLRRFGTPDAWAADEPSAEAPKAEYVGVET